MVTMTMIFGQVHKLALFVGVLSFLVGLALTAMMDAGDSTKRLGRLAFLLSVVAFVCFCSFQIDFLIDDALISLRYARNLAQGHGLVFSTDGSPRVEGYTNFLQVIIETPLFWFNLSTPAVIRWVKIIGIAFGVGIVVVTYMLTRRVTSDRRAAALAALFVSAIPNMAFWSVGGLETPMYIFWLVAGLYLHLIEDRHGRTHILSLLLFMLAALARPEGLFFLAVVACWDWLIAFRCSNEKRRLALRLCCEQALVLLLYGTYFICRYRYYGYLLPNTFYARSGQVGIGQILFRLGEMQAFLAYLLPLLAVALVGWFLHAGAVAREKAFLAVALFALFAFSFASKREWMPGFRYELPMIPILAVFTAAGMSFLFEKTGAGTRMEWLRVGVLLCAAGFIISPVIPLRKAAKDNAEILSGVHIPTGEWLKRYAPPGSSYAGFDMGAIPYYSEIPRIIEIAPEGILSIETTHLGYDPRRILALKPTFITMPPEAWLAMAESPMREIYASDDFNRDYVLLAVFCPPNAGVGRTYCLYARKSAQIPQTAIDEIRSLSLICAAPNKTADNPPPKTGTK